MSSASGPGCVSQPRIRSALHLITAPLMNNANQANFKVIRRRAAAPRISSPRYSDAAYNRLPRRHSHGGTNSPLHRPARASWAAASSSK